jgi:DNA-binding transcriptional MerR regulator
MDNSWTRLEVSKLAGITPTQLDYLSKLELVTPKRIGDKRPVVLYSWSQLIVIRAYAKLRQECSLQALRDAVKYLDKHPEQLLADKRLVAYENKIYWIDDTANELYNAVTVSGKGQGQLIMTFTMLDLLDDLRNVGKGEIVDFADRFKNAA